MRSNKVFFTILAILFLLVPNNRVNAAITSGSSVNGVTSTSHTVNTSSTNSSIVFSWTAATSGISGSAITYDYVVSTDTSLDNSTFETRLTSTETTTLKRGSLSNTTTVTASSLADGSFYFYIRAKDSGGIIVGTSITQKGPYVLNSQPTLNASTPISPASGAHKSAISVTVNGTNFISGATLKLINGKRTSGSTTVTLSDVTLTNVTFVSSSQLTATVPADTPPGVYDVSVTNAAPWSKAVSAVGKYTSSNTLPTAATGGNQTVSLSNGSASVSLNGATTGAASSDADGDTLASYTWTLASMPTGATITSGSSTLSTNSTLTGVTQTVVAKTAGTYTFSLVVNDGFENSTASTMTLSVSAAAGANNAPIANPGSSAIAAIGSAVTLSGSQSSDPDGNTLTSYTWKLVSKPTGSALITDATTSITQTSPPAASFTPDMKGDYVISLVVNDGTVNSDAKTVTITANTAPVANAGSAQTKAASDVVTLDGSSSVDADTGDTALLTYTWTQTSGTTVTLSANGTTSAKQPTFTPTVAGSYIFSLAVSDGVQSSTNSSTVTITVNDRPVANAGANQVVAPSATVTLSATASTKATGATLTYAWSQTLGTGVTLSSSTAVSPTFTAPSTAGTLTFSLTVTDSFNVTSTASTTVYVNNRPTANAGSAQTVTTAGTVTLSGSGTDVDASTTLTYSWSITSQPTGSDITLSSATAQSPTFTPVVNGTYVFALLVNDGKENSAAASSVTITFSGGRVLDVDKSGTTDATDGVLLLRRLNGASTIDTGVVLPTGQTNTTVIATITAAGTAFDVDSSGTVDATDGVLILRRLNGASTIDTGVVLPTGQTNTTVITKIDASK